MAKRTTKHSKEDLPRYDWRWLVEDKDLPEIGETVLFATSLMVIQNFGKPFERTVGGNFFRSRVDSDYVDGNDVDAQVRYAYCRKATADETAAYWRRKGMQRLAEKSAEASAAIKAGDID